MAVDVQQSPEEKTAALLADLFKDGYIAPETYQSEFVPDIQISFEGLRLDTGNIEINAFYQTTDPDKKGRYKFVVKIDGRMLMGMFSEIGNPPFVTATVDQLHEILKIVIAARNAGNVKTTWGDIGLIADRANASLAATLREEA